MFDLHLSRGSCVVLCVCDQNTLNPFLRTVAHFGGEHQGPSVYITKLFFPHAACTLAGCNVCLEREKMQQRDAEREAAFLI